MPLQLVFILLMIPCLNLIDLHVVFDQPHKISLSPSPFDNQTHRILYVFGSDSLLGMELIHCPQFGLPKLTSCKKGTPSARIPRWRSELRNAFVTSVNDSPTPTIDSIAKALHSVRSSGANTVKIEFDIIEKYAMHLQKDIP